MAKEKMTLKAYDWDPATSSLTKNSVDRVYHMPHSEENKGAGAVKSYGMPTTVRAFQEMIKRYKEVAETDPTIFSKLINVTFSKASILRILSQEGCEAIRIWQAIPNADGKVSLVLEGLNFEHKPLNQTAVLRTLEADGRARIHNEEDPIYEERGNGEDEGGEGFISQKSTTEIASMSLSEFMNELFTAFAKK